MLLAHELSGDPTAPAIVLVHGITENRETWRPIIEALAADHRVLAVDLRGHGASDREPPYDPPRYGGDVAETIAAAGLTEPLIVGHSLGGVVVTAVPAFCPDVVGVVNVDQPLELGGFRNGLQMIEPMLRGTDEEFAQAIAMVFDGMSGALSGDPLERVRAIRRPDRDVVLGTWALILDGEPAELDAALDGLFAGVGDRPYLSLHGIDPGPAYADWLQTRIPRAVVEVWPDLGHYPMLVEQQRFLERLADFECEVRR